MTLAVKESKTCQIGFRLEPELTKREKNDKNDFIIGSAGTEGVNAPPFIMKLLMQCL